MSDKNKNHTYTVELIRDFPEYDQHHLKVKKKELGNEGAVSGPSLEAASNAHVKHQQCITEDALLLVQP